MKKHVLPFAITLLCLLLSIPAAEAQDDGLVSLRIMSYNIRHGAGMDDVIDLDRQAAVINAALPDVVGLQEVDSCVKRSGYKPQAALLGEKTGMHATFGGAIPLTGGKYGVAILSKEPPLTVHHLPLPGTEKRTLLVCEFEEYVFACTHLDLDDECRLASLPIIQEEVAKWGDKPFFICGDWNDKPSSNFIKQVKKAGFFLLNNTNAYTFPANNPTSTIDYIASYGRIHKSIKRRTVINEPKASDHRPILVELTLESYTTGIQTPSACNEETGREDGGIYDLSGRKMAEGKWSGTRLRRGLYIDKNKRQLIAVR